MATQTQIPGTERAENARLEQLNEQLRAQCVANAEGRSREKDLRRQILTELLGLDPERKELVEQLLALGPPTYRYIDGNGIEIESVMELELKAKVHKTGEQEAQVGEGVPEHEDDAPPPPRRKKAEKSEKVFDPEAAAAAAAAAEDQRANGVAEDEDGDVVPPEKAKPSKKPAKKKGRR